MIDYSVMLYDPAFGELGVPATLNGIEITVIDDTRSKMQPGGGGVEVRSVAPGAFARIPELDGKGIAREDYQDALITFNGRNWIIYNYDVRGSPNGEDLGLVRFLLRAAAASS